MASTDAKSGFRLPWSADRNDSDEPGTTSADPTADPAQPQSVDEGPVVNDALDSAQDNGSAVSPDPVPSSDAAPVSSAPSTRKPNKFMADLTKAMQTAAEAARADVLEKFSAEAKAHIEGIHAGSADEATALRKKADDDIAGVREWSKNEIARIREETDERIAHRKEVLEREIEAHAAQIEARIERIQSRVTSFEGEMDFFFERLLAEDDPTRFAAMAETLPEPPAFDDLGSGDWSATTSTVEAQTESETPVATDDWGAPEPALEANEHLADAAEDPSVPDPAPGSSGWEAEAPVAEAAVSDDAPAAEAAVAVAEAPEADATPEAASGSTNDDTGDLFGIAADAPSADAPAADVDPRLSALGMDQDFAAAEAEAGAFTADAKTDEEEIPVIAEDALAARLAGLVAEEPAAPNDAASTRVAVTGLVSVASIAGFKRNLSRVNGVRSVGVSSGPDGEFVFAVTHDPGLDLNDGIATLPGFGARVTNEAPGELTVAARDPESEG